MSRRVDVDEALPAVEIPGRILDELRQHAWDTLPAECCGLIIGDDRERYGRVVRSHNDMNQRPLSAPSSYPRDAKTAFWMRETDYQKAVREAEERGLHITAVYHSHVGVDAYLSDEDLAYAEQELFPFPNADQLVIGVPFVQGGEDAKRQLIDKDLKPRVAVFRRHEPGAPFRGHESREPGA